MGFPDGVSAGWLMRPQGLSRTGDPYFRPNKDGKCAPTSSGAERQRPAGLGPVWCHRRVNILTNSWRIAIVAAAALIAAGVLVAPALSAPGKDKVYTIANYPVEASAQDAVAAKEKAHAEGQQAALGALLKRLVPVTAYNHIDSLKHLRADDFSNGVAVRSETNSRTQYIASLDFSFQPDAVRGLLQREGVPFVDEQAPRMVLVPLTAVTGEGGSVSYTPA